MLQIPPQVKYRSTLWHSAGIDGAWHLGGAHWRLVRLPVPAALDPTAARSGAEPISPPVFATSQIGAVLVSLDTTREHPTVYYTTNGGASWRWMLLPPLPPYTKTLASWDRMVAPARLQWQPFNEGWLLTVLNRSHRVIAQWPVTG